MNLVMSQNVRDTLEELRDDTDAESLSEVVRKALAVYRLVWSEKARGCTLHLRKEDGSERELLVL